MNLFPSHKISFFQTFLIIIQLASNVMTSSSVQENNHKSSPCKYSLMCGLNGHCEMQFDQEICVCKEGFVGKRCQLKDPCLSSSCSDHGSCYAIFQLINNVEEVNFYCQCNNGYSGRNCEVTEMPCLSNPCHNNGICVNNDNKNGDGFTCICMNGYVGSTCGAYVGPCYYNECENGATCIEEKNSKYNCECKPGFYGEHCQFDVNECIVKKDSIVTSPCQHNGKCYDLVNDYFCECHGPYTGQNCEIYKNPCESDPCKKGSYCVPFEDTFKCPCSEDYYGAECRLNPCTKNPCKVKSSRCIPVDSNINHSSSNGTSTMSTDDLFVCVCASLEQEFIGFNC